jgi:hypothetical protein
MSVMAGDTAFTNRPGPPASTERAPCGDRSRGCWHASQSSGPGVRPGHAGCVFRAHSGLHRTVSYELSAAALRSASVPRPPPAFAGTRTGFDIARCCSEGPDSRGRYEDERPSARLLVAGHGLAGYDLGVLGCSWIGAGTVQDAARGRQASPVVADIFLRV